MTYRAILWQDGEGCGYTIGCGIEVVDLSAKTKDEALAEAKALWFGEDFIGDHSYHPDYYDGDHYGERVVLSVAIVKDVCDAPVEDWVNEYETIRDERKHSEEADAERKEYERLRAKFEDGYEPDDDATYESDEVVPDGVVLMTGRVESIPVHAMSCVCGPFVATPFFSGMKYEEES